MPIAYIGIGSNMGNRPANCLKACRSMAGQGIKVLKTSSMLETEPWGVTDQPKFINMAAKVETDLDPENLLETLKEIETASGRKKGVRWGPRVIDLDILMYDDMIVKSKDLEIPHPRIAEREFVLRPLVEIAPDLLHPTLMKNIEEILGELAGSE